MKSQVVHFVKNYKSILLSEKEKEKILQGTWKAAP